MDIFIVSQFLTLFCCSERMFVYSTSRSEVCTTLLSTPVTTICHGCLEGISSIKLKSGCLSRASPGPLGTTLLPSASMGTAFPDSTHKWGHTAWFFCIRPTACGRVPSRFYCDVIWQGLLLFCGWLVFPPLYMLTASRALHLLPAKVWGEDLTLSSAVQCLTFKHGPLQQRVLEQLDSTGKSHAPWCNLLQN